MSGAKPIALTVADRQVDGGYQQINGSGVKIQLVMNRAENVGREFGEKNTQQQQTECEAVQEVKPQRLGGQRILLVKLSVCVHRVSEAAWVILLLRAF